MNVLNQSRIFKDKIRIHATMEKNEIEDERNRFQVFKRDSKLF